MNLGLLGHVWLRFRLFINRSNSLILSESCVLSLEPNHSSCLCIGGRPAEESESRQTGGGSDSLATMVDRAPPADHPSPSGKGKGKIREIRYPNGSEYLKVAVKYAETMGPNRVEPLYEKPSLPAIDPLLAFKSGALIFSPPTSSRFQDGLLL